MGEGGSAPAPALKGDVARRAFDTVAAVRKAGSLSELQQIVKGCFEVLGFSMFIGFDSVNAAGKPDVQILFGQEHGGWEPHYLERGLAKHDPIIKATKLQAEPFFWSDVLGGRILGPAEKAVMNEAGEFGLRNGFVAPLHNLDGSITSVLLSGPNIDAGDPDLRAAAHLVSVYFGAMGRRLKRKEDAQRAPVRLTQRQLDCLRWVREGKSSHDIGDILGLSPRTVQEYVGEACARLGVRTRVQAVAEAALRGLIDL